MKKALLFIGFILLLAACGEDTTSGEEPSSAEAVSTETAETEASEETTEVVEEKAAEDTTEETEPVEEEIVPPTPQELMLFNLIELMEEGLVFDTGSYIKGDIPKGEYAFITFEGSGKYYSEEDASGSIIDNENFHSFGYVQVHEAGNLETRGVLVSMEALDELEVSGAKEIYELLNNKSDYADSGLYKVGIDIEPGEYVLESYGSGYVAVLTGPVGNYDIVQNDNFDGRYSVNVQEGQYLDISRATIVE